MPKEMYIVIAALVSVIAAYITAKITGNIQVRIAELNAKKDIQLQEDELHEGRIKAEVDLEREKLERFHIILSKIALGNSQTMSFIQSDSAMNLKQFREMYLENSERLHEAQAIADLYYPSMSEAVREIYGQSNILWGHQEGVLKTDIEQNKERWQFYLSKVLKAGEEIARHVSQLKHKVAARGEELNT